MIDHNWFDASELSLFAATQASVESFTDPVEIVVAVWATLYPELVSPAQPTSNTARKNSLRECTAFVIRYFAAHGKLNLLEAACEQR